MSEKQALTQALRFAESKNSHCSNTLQKELEKLDHDRMQRMRELDHDTTQLRDKLPDHSTSRPSPPTVTRQPHRKKSGHASHLLADPASHKEKAGGTSDSQAKESRKASVSQPSTQPFVTQLDGSYHKASHGREDKPRIAIRDNVTDKHHVGSAGLARRRSVDHTSSPIGPRRGSIDSGSDVSGTILSQSFSLSPHRARSNSLTASHPAPHPPLRRLSVCPVTNSRSRDGLHIPDMQRERSSSFSGIVPVRRRGSICERFGSLSERELNRGADHDRRETITDMAHMIRDLSYGIQHRELLHRDDKTSASAQLMEELKSCRYLRVPQELAEAE